MNGDAVRANFYHLPETVAALYKINTCLFGAIGAVLKVTGYGFVLMGTVTNLCRPLERL
jgi:hypothetical protein